MTTTTPSGVLAIVDPAAAASRPELPLEGYEGVTYRLLWRAGKSVAGIMVIAPGAKLDDHRHRSSEHHMWVLKGSGRVGGRPIGEGTYLHVPVGVTHGIDQVGPDGCTVLYLYLRNDGPTGAVRPRSAVPGTAPIEAHAGDQIVVHGHHAGEPDRDGEVLEARGGSGRPPYLVRWSDTGHETLFFPGNDATVRHLGHPDT